MLNSVLVTKGNLVKTNAKNVMDQCIPFLHKIIEYGLSTKANCSMQYSKISLGSSVIFNS